MTDYLLDTNVIINFLRGDRMTISYMEQILLLGGVLHACEITIAETYTGMREDEREATETFLNSLIYLSTNRLAAQKSGEWRRFYRNKNKNITLADALIAATALQAHLILLTENLKDYPMPELRKESPLIQTI